MTTDDTIFHKIIRKEIPADIIHEDDRVIVIKDISPVADTHLLIIPKQSLISIKHAKSSDESLLGHMLLTAAEMARKMGIEKEGYRVVINTGEGGGQTVFQLHMHLIGGRELKWPPG